MRATIVSTTTRCSDCAIKNTTRAASVAGRHTFSTSSPRRKHGAVPVFTETSSTELQDLLEKARSKLIFPAHLPKQQQHLIYKKKNLKVLASEEATSIVAGEEFKLVHINKTKDVPGGYRTLWDAMSLMKEKKDWDNLPRLLHGLNNASALKLNNSKNLWQKEKLARNISAAGRQDILLECIRRSAVTDMTLNSGRFVGQIMFHFQLKAFLSDWDPEETSKALKWVEMVSLMMEDPAHSGRKHVNDYWMTPEVPGILLELAAIRAAKHLGGEDKDGKVAEYATRLVQCLASEHCVGYLDIDGDKTALSRWLSLYSPVLFGMRQALKVLDPASETASELATRAEELEVLVHKYGSELAAMPASKEDAPRGLQDFEELFPKASIS